jgi:hypothetical protein
MYFVGWLNGVLAERQVGEMICTFEIAANCGL